MTTYSKLTTDDLIFYDGITINTQFVSSTDTLTLYGAGGVNEINIKNIKNPILPQDVATKNYVDNLVISGITWKNAANVATTIDITLGSISDVSQVATNTIDTIVFTISDSPRIVLKNQSTSSENGIYVLTLCTNVSFFYWIRSDDAVASDPANGSAIFVFNGSVNNDKTFVVTNDAVVNWDSGVIFTLMSQAPIITVAGSDTMVQYNDSGVFGAIASYTFNKSTTTPIFGFGSDATTITSTINIGTGGTNSTGSINLSNGSGASTITATSTGDFNIDSTSSNIFVGNSTTGSVIIGNTSSSTAGLKGILVTLGNTTTTSLDILSTGESGIINIDSGSGGTTGVGGDITINSGNGGTVSGNSGLIIIQAGLSTGTGTDGNIILKMSNTTVSSIENIIQFQNSLGAEIGRIENTGDMYVNTLNSSSDIRYKTNIEQLNGSLEIINKINGYSYNWKKTLGRSDKLQYGFLAQQLEEIGLNNLVTGTEESKSVNYLGIIPILIEAIKELNNKLDQIKN